MAKDKKSFILYCDQKALFDQLPDEKAGQLIKHIFKYVNDENPETSDLVINIAFAPIKQQFKRDLDKYEAIRERNRENARKRWDATACDRIPKHAKNADNDNDNVNVNVSDNDITTKRKIKKEKVELVYPFTSPEFFKALDNWYLYKQEQHRFKFKSDRSHQAFLKQISKDFNSDHEVIEAIEYSMANGYRGIFKPQKSQTNGSKNNQVQYNEQLKRKLLNDLTA